ncbi:MAG: Bax inhibitor-1/YccA family protein [Treponema sp.]|nr:Bax inhibitor-1/YccA family protein [Spirochaetia bacterium]MDD7013416.1 Bax inhibitor-1/YccA family protein [Spirochaetales bacterium]MDY4901574.1 Bax inhibitor-1/YccA family protein [Treponema sp.]
MESLENYKSSSNEKTTFLARTYLWMFFALLLSAASSYFAATDETLFNFVWRKGGYIFLFIGEFALVFVLSALVRKLSAFSAALLFICYSIINGLTISSIFIRFQIDSIAYCFIGTALLFLVMSIYGFTTKQSLAKAGHYLMMALVGVIIVSILNGILTFAFGQDKTYFFINELISIATVVIFTGLTAYDTQKILAASENADGSESYKKLSILAALELYLDFINIFLYLLRLFGNTRKN